jgi:xanthine/uracil/vitamin C permease (AzgA family)
VAVDRDSRNRHTTALTCGVMVEILLGTSLVVWLGSSTATGTAAFGRPGSVAVVGSAMVVLAVAMVVATIPARLARVALVTIVSLFFLVFAGVAGRARTEPGPAVLLVLGWVLAVPIATHITRAAGARPRSHDSPHRNGRGTR